jgi:GC-rich sequence DNA-binding factor
MEMINKRRADDNEDDLVLLYGVPADMVQASEEPQVDELGRALPSSTEPHSAVRRARRQERMQRKAAHSRSQSNSTQDEDYATDGSLPPSDAADFEMAISSLKEKVQTVLFKDVKAKAFRDPKHGIAIWFGEWREKWPDIYHNAFGGMGLVQAWEFWARAEIIGWVPFDVSPRAQDPLLVRRRYPE